MPLPLVLCAWIYAGVSGLGCVNNKNLLFCYMIIYQQHNGYEVTIFITFFTLVFPFLIQILDISIKNLHSPGTMSYCVPWNQLAKNCSKIN